MNGDKPKDTTASQKSTPVMGMVVAGLVIVLIVAGVIYAVTRTEGPPATPEKMTEDTSMQEGQSAITAENLDEFIVTVGGEILVGEENQLAPAFTARSASKEEFDALETKAEETTVFSAPYRIETVEDTGDRLKYDVSVTAVGGSTFIDPFDIVIDQDVVTIELYQGDALVSTLSRPDAPPAVVTFNKMPLQETAAGDARAVIEYSWEIESQAVWNTGVVFEYHLSGDLWQHVFAGQYPLDTSFTLDPADVSTSLDTVDIRLTATDGFHAVVLTETDSFPSSLSTAP